MKPLKDLQDPKGLTKPWLEKAERGYLYRQTVIAY